ncbi:undecaprenyl-diphosphate phosphatase [Candidatus Pacearchaeota archaeon]|nr:undecaprenyl-diphosphate phosphatase [Candidatus Pacearchaeota archaeon]
MPLTIIQQIILGVIQGITEWLPVSSSGFVALVMTNFFGITDLGFLLQSALFLHLGTFFAALIYFRSGVWDLTKSLFNYKQSERETKLILKFLIISTLISGILGLLILKGLTSFESYLDITGKTITFVVGFLLLFTGAIQVKAKQSGLRKELHLKNKDGVLLGFAQGLASLPGISRSGITVSTLLLKKFDDTSALRLSFLMSLPIVLIANIILNIPDFGQIITVSSIYGLLAAFVFGLATIHGLMKLSRKINFGWFVLVFGGLMLGSLLV